MSRSVVVNIIGRDEASPAFRSVASSADKVGSRVSGAFKSAIGMAAKLGATLGAYEAARGALDVTREAVAFQQNMTLIETQAGATSGAVKRMSGQILTLSGKVAQSPEDLSTAMYHIYSVGLKGAQALNVLKIAAEGAKVGNADLEETTNAMTASVASGIKGVQNMHQAMGALNTIVGAGDMKLSDLNDALGSGILVVAKQFGLNLTDVGAALDTFGDNNIRGANAATMLRVAITSMADPVAKGAKILAAMGLSTNSLAKDMQHGGLGQALEDLKSHLAAAGITGSKVGEVLTEAFGKKAGPGISVLIDQLSRFQTKQKAITDGGNQFGARWKATTSTASFAFAKLKDTLNAVAMSLAMKLLPYLSKAATWVANFVPKVTAAVGAVGNWLKANRGVAIALGAIAAALGVATVALTAWWIATKIATAVQAAFTAVMDANPIILVITAIAALAVGLIYAYEHCATFRKIVQDAFSAVATAGKAVWDGLQWAYDHVLKPVLPIMLGAFKAWWALQKIVFAVVVDTVKALWDGLQWAYEHVLKPVLGLIKGAISGWWTVQKVTFGLIVDAGKAIWDGLQWAYDHVLKPIIATIEGAIRAFKTAVGAILGGLSTAVKNTWGAVKNLVGGSGKLVGKSPQLSKWLQDASDKAAKLWANLGGALDTVIKLVNASGKTITVKGSGGGVGGGKYHLAQGGMTRGPGLFVMGDNPSGREVALPLDSPNTIEALSAAMAKAGAGSTTNPAPLAGRDLVINQTGDPIQTARTIARYQRARAAV